MGSLSDARISADGASTDTLRKSFYGEHVKLSELLHVLPLQLKTRVIDAVKSQDLVKNVGDRSCERNLVRVHVDDLCFVARIDYYDHITGEATNNVFDASSIVRVVTIMLETELQP